MHEQPLRGPPGPPGPPGSNVCEILYIIAGTTECAGLLVQFIHVFILFHAKMNIRALLMTSPDFHTILIPNLANCREKMVVMGSMEILDHQ